MPLATDFIHSRIADLLFWSRIWMNWQSLCNQDTIGSWHLSAASSCHLRKLSSFWPLFENSKGYQHLWNRERKIVYLPSKTLIGWNVWVATHLFLLLWRWKLYTVVRLIMFSNRLHCTMRLSTSCVKTVFCSQSYLINARDKLPFQEVCQELKLWY